jgi:HK97 family phage major capsid protein
MTEIRERYLSLNLEPMEAGEAPELEDQPPKQSVYRFSVASEEPVNMGGFREVLSHASGAIDLSRLPGMNFLWQHGHDSIGKKPLGKVESWTIQNRKSYISVRPTLEEYALPFWRQVDDKILTDVSIRYEVLSDRQIDNNTIFVDKWQAVHATLCVDPADPSVGHNRSLDEPESYKSNININEYPAGGIMDDTTTIDKKELIKAESLRQREIRAAGENFTELFNNPKFRELANTFIESDYSVDESRALFSKEIEKLPANRAIATPNDPTKLGLSKKEKKEFSVLRAIRSITDGFPEYQKNCHEREISNEIAKRLNKPIGGIYIPTGELHKEFVGSRERGLSYGVDSAGGFTVDTELRSGDFIELLRKKAMVFGMGAKFLPGLTADVDVPGQASAAQAYWLENENDEPEESEMSFRQISLRMKTVGAVTTMSRQFLMQTSIAAENLATDDLAKVIALATDLAAINGTGTNGQPLGLLQRSINEVALGTNGAALTYANLVNLCKEIEIDDADISTMQWLTNPFVKAALMLTPKQTGGVEGNYILGETASSLLGYGFNVTNQMPSNLTKGNGTGLSSAILGCWDQLVIGLFGVLQINTNTQGRTFRNGGIEIRALQSMDINVRHLASFAAFKDIVTT